MGKGPGLYVDIGKKARGNRDFIFCSLLNLFSFCDYFDIFFLNFSKFPDLLYKDYQSDHKFTVTTYTSTGVVIFSPFPFIFFINYIFFLNCGIDVLF
jgi:voltage-dependent anion channel protein 2